MLNSSILNKIINVPHDIKLNDGDLLYHGSLVPNKETLKQIRHVAFVVSLRDKPNCDSIEPYNTVNSHLYKPKYIITKKKHEVACYVASKDVLYHTIRSLAVMSFVVNNSDISISVEDSQDRYHNYYSDCYIHDRVLIGRIESVLNFIRLVWLIEHSPLRPEEIKDIAITLELSRIGETPTNYMYYLEEKYLRHHSLTFKILDKRLGFELYEADSPYVKQLNFSFRNHNISAFQLPWGSDLSTQLIDLLRQRKPRINKLGIVGGVGYVGDNDNVKVDDVFIPNEIIENVNDSYVKRPINNMIMSQGENKYFNSKCVFKGSIKTIVPEIGQVSYTRPILDQLSGLLDTVDMEKEMILKGINLQRTSLASMYYIMDIPSRNIGLGDTYYNSNFLRKLLGTYERGKYYCFEKVLNFLSGR